MVDGWTGKWMDRWWMDGRVSGWTDGGWLDGRVSGWMDGWMDEVLPLLHYDDYDDVNMA